MENSSPLRVDEARRSLMRSGGVLGLSAMMAGFGGAANAQSTPDIIKLDAPNPFVPKHKIRFSVCGMSHDHIYGMCAAVIKGGGELVSAWGAETDKRDAFAKRFPNCKMVDTKDAVLDEASTHLILSSHVASERAALGIGAMKNGKDFLADKPGITTLKDLKAVRDTIKSTGRKYNIQYSERLDVRAAVYAGELIKSGAIGQVIQTINLAPHQIFQRRGGDAGGSGGRPDWFWDDAQFGGILCDIGSHQLDQFLYYTGSTEAKVAFSQVGNLRHPDHPKFQDFGDMTLVGNRGTGYVRLDWFTPYGLGTWGDGRLFILGTEGYIEVRKYINVGVGGGNHLIMVDQKKTRVFDCSAYDLPFGPQLVDDIVNRTETAQNQTQCLLTAELSILAQKNAKRLKIET